MSTSIVKTVNCPACGAPVAWAPENRYRPFCSARCKGIDLGAWANDEYRVAGKPEDDDGALTRESAHDALRD